VRDDADDRVRAGRPAPLLLPRRCVISDAHFLAYSGEQPRSRRALTVEHPRSRTGMPPAVRPPPAQNLAIRSPQNQIVKELDGRRSILTLREHPFTQLSMDYDSRLSCLTLRL